MGPGQTRQRDGAGGWVSTPRLARRRWRWLVGALAARARPLRRGPVGRRRGVRPGVGLGGVSPVDADDVVDAEELDEPGSEGCGVFDAALRICSAISVKVAAKAVLTELPTCFTSALTFGSFAAPPSTSKTSFAASLRRRTAS